LYCDRLLFDYGDNSWMEVVNPGRSWTRLDGVDLLRGLAIFFVLMNHINMRLLGAKVPYTHGMPPQMVLSLVWNGQFGVQMFFAVSGFLITATALRRWGSIARVNVKEFYQLRFARIAPLLLLLLAVLSALHFAGVKGFVVSAKTGGLGRALFAALTFHVNLLEARRGYLPAGWDILWSLSVEEMFYLFFPLVCRVFRRERILTVVLVCLAVAGPFARAKVFNHNPVWREYSYLGGMDAIALGCLTALLMARVTMSRKMIWVVGSVGVVLLVFSLAFSLDAYKWGLGRDGLNMTVLAVGTCCAIAAAAQSQWKSWRVLRPLLAMGQRSYEIYLTHIFVVLVLFDFFVSRGKPMAAVWPMFAVAIVLAGMFGWAVACGYSEPMNRWLRERWRDGPVRLGSVVEES
jgi:peptidoglycan/LPS O-acetylase OafA/YrhL